MITSAELNDAQVRMLETEWNLLQAKYAKIVAAARAKVAAGGLTTGSGSASGRTLVSWHA